MKAMKYLSMLLMMVALSVCMVGCGSDDDELLPLLLGIGAKLMMQVR